MCASSDTERDHWVTSIVHGQIGAVQKDAHAPTSPRVTLDVDSDDDRPEPEPVKESSKSNIGVPDLTALVLEPSKFGSGLVSPGVEPPKPAPRLPRQKIVASTDVGTRGPMVDAVYMGPKKISHEVPPDVRPFPVA